MWILASAEAAEPHKVLEQPFSTMNGWGGGGGLSRTRDDGATEKIQIKKERCSFQPPGGESE